MPNDSQMVLYAGYGAMSKHAHVPGELHNTIIATVIDRVPEIDERFTKIADYELRTQTLMHISNTVAQGGQFPISPREILRGNWGPQFRSYVTRPLPGACVPCTVWLITEQERLMILDWELGRDGWMSNQQVKITNDDGTLIGDAVSEGITVHQEYDDDYLVDIRKPLVHFAPPVDVIAHAKTLRQMQQAAG